MGFTTDLPGGWYDIPDTVWTAGNQVIEDHLIALNSLVRFAAVCDEYLPAAPQQDGDTVALSVSADDGYSYARAEALYAWAAASSLNPKTGTQSGQGDLLFFVQAVAQDTGKVSALVNYYVQGGQDQAQTDGLLAVLLCVRRGAGQRTVVAGGTGGGPAGGGGGLPTGGSGGGSTTGGGWGGDQGNQGDGTKQGNQPRAVF